MPITFDVREHPLFKEGVELGIEKGVELKAKQDAINLYRKLKLTPKQIGEILEIDPQKVEEWLKEENFLKEG